MIRALVVVVAIASCHRQTGDDETLKRLTLIEQRLDAQDRAIAEARPHAGTAELSVLAQQVAELQAQLAEIAAQLKYRPAARPPRREPDPTATYAVPLGKSPAFGPASAKVTLVMAMEFDCRFCRRAWDTVDELRKKYGKDLRVVYKPYVVHPRTAGYAARAACAAHRQGRWREMADLLWTKAFAMKPVDPDAFDPERIDALAKQARLEMATYKTDVGAPCATEVRDEMAVLQKLGATGTPTFFINGRYLSGAKPLEDFAQVIDEEAAKATAAYQRGIKPERYYEQEIVGKGLSELAQP